MTTEPTEEFIHWNRPVPPQTALPLGTILPAFDAAGSSGRAPKWHAWKRRQIARFVAWAGGRGLSSAGQVTRSEVAAYFADLSAPDGKGRMHTAETLRKVKIILARALATALPRSVQNPFESLTIESRAGDRIFNRTPLTPREVGLLLDAARDDLFTYDLIVAGLCTGLRRGDICRLRWESVDLAANTIRLVTSKTQTPLSLPILPLLRDVFLRHSERRMPGEVYVFPSAASMLERNPAGITWRIKKAFTLAFSSASYTGGVRHWSRRHLAEQLPAVIAAIERSKYDPGKQRTIIALLYAYAEHRNLTELSRFLGISRGTRHNYLRLAETLSGIRFLPDDIRRFKSVNAALCEITRVHRPIGIYSASKYDFHALRTSFVTLAINGGISIDKLRAITGHHTVDMVLRHYFKPKGTDIAGDLRRALPSVLTGYEGRPRDLVSRLYEKIQGLCPSDRTRLIDKLRLAP